MSKAPSTVALLLGLYTLSPDLTAAESMSRPGDRIVRPGDRIEWVVPNPHRLRVGGAGLTSLEGVDKILNFSPALTPKPGNIRESGSDAPVTGTVKDGAEMQGVANFVFTCGAHPGQMLSHPFTVEAKVDGEAPRTFRITADDDLRWIMERRDVQVDTTP